MKIERIYLTGFMTSGKSTIGPILANVLGWSFYDLDNKIVEVQGRSIVDIFNDDGEEKFREIESETLNKLVKNKNLVIALGGGAIVGKRNLDLLKKTGKIIYLKSSPEAIYRRIKNKIDRPVFRDLVLSENSEEDFIKRISDLLKEREPYYMNAHLIFDTDKTKIGVTVDAIAKQINKLINENN